jgi:3-hydroxybutyryl-CoA dehydrogenase
MKIGIIGEGKMGSGIFHYLLDFPYPLRWLVSQDADLEQLQKGLEKKIRRSLRAGIVSEEEGSERLQKTNISKEINVLEECNLVIEAIPEEISMKQNLFTALHSVLPPQCIVATNSSSIPPSALWYDPQRDLYIMGIHFFYPVALKETVEVMTTKLNPPEVIEIVINFIREINKKPLLLDEENGFILNRLFLDVQNEGWHLVEQGAASIEQLDKMVTSNLFPFGLFDFMDSVGIDTMKASVERYIEPYPHRDHYEGLLQKLSEMEKAGHLGRKKGCGFYTYHKDTSPDAVNPKIISELTKDKEDEILNHLRNTWLNSARRFTMLSGCTIDEMNDAIKDYFGLEKGPFDS